MATPVDSSEMITYKSVKSYEKRFSDSYKHLKDYVDIWEIGNEINGENWIGKDEQFIADKIGSRRLLAEQGIEVPGEDDLDILPSGLYFMQQFDAVHAGHHHIQNETTDRKSVV